MRERELTKCRRTALVPATDSANGGCGRVEVSMRNVVLALLSAGGLAMVGAAPAEAVGTRYPFCIQGGDISRPEPMHLHQL